MKIIRKNIFEVNSSSCHSISIDNDDKTEFEKPRLNLSGNFEIEGMDFGWSIREYNDTFSKCSYIAIYIRDWCNDKQKEFKDKFEKVIKDYTQCNEIEYEKGFWKNDGFNGYIDHQSVEDEDYHYLLDEYHKDYKEGELKNFLFKLNSVLETDNDNH